MEQEENKVLRAQMDLAQTKQEIERRLQEKEEEFENTRKNFARALDSMQASLDGEVKAKEEALRIKKKIESDINEMEISLDHANKANVETSKQIKRLATNLLEIDTAVEEEARIRADIEDQVGIVERKGIVFFSIFPTDFLYFLCISIKAMFWQAKSRRLGFFLTRQKGLESMSMLRFQMSARPSQR